MTDSLKRQDIVDNHAGANGIIGSESLRRSPADGYTLLRVQPARGECGPVCKAAYDTLRDFAPVAMVTSSPYVVGSILRFRCVT